MTDRTDTTRTTTRQTTTTTRPPRPARRYPDTEENVDAPLVPFIQRPDETDEMTDIRRELSALRSQLNRIERAMQEPTDSQ